MNEIAYETLCRLRGENVIKTIGDNADRHKLFVKENDGFTAYYFSVPIRKIESFVNDTDFLDKDTEQFICGTNCSVTVTDVIKIKGVNTEINIGIPGAREWYRAGRDIICGSTRISPTLNGISICCPISRGGSVDVIVTTINASEELRCNSKYFAFMKQRFVPSFTVSPIGVKGDKVFGALLLSARPEKEVGEYRLTFTSPDTCGEMCVEFNMHEQKLIQDTTVESARPDENNAYGTSAFIGHSDTFGAQQMYIKFNYPVLGDFGRDNISSIKLYMPILGGNMPPLEALHMDNRFCSFGSVWNKRIKPSGEHLSVTYHNGFCCVDLSDVMIDRAGRLRFSNGFHLRTYRDGIGYCVLATGDSHLFPPVLEMRSEQTNKN